MNALYSDIQPADAGLSHNRAEMDALVARLSRLEDQQAASSEARRAILDRRGQLSARARLAVLLDPDTSFVNLFNLAGCRLDADGKPLPPEGGCITGIGFVAGVRTMVIIDDAHAQGGALTRAAAEKILGAIEIAQRQQLPLLHLVDSLGLDLGRYDMDSWSLSGRIYSDIARLAARGVPVISVLHGAAIGASALFVGLADFVIGVKDQGFAMLSGAAHVRALRGEIARDAALGGAEMHASVTGLVDYLAEDDRDALLNVREVMGALDWRSKRPSRPSGAEGLSTEMPERVLDLVTAARSCHFDLFDLASLLVDGGELRPFKSGFGPDTLCLRGRLMGHAIGIVAQNGRIESDGARKMIDFLTRMEQSGTPVLFLHNTTGFDLGRQAERAGVLQLASRLIRRVSTLAVPKLVLKVGASFGPAGFALAGQGQGADFIFSWPNARSGAVDSQEAALTMEHVARRSALKRSMALDEGKLATQRERLRDSLAEAANAFAVSGRGYDMGVIDPRDSRRVLGACLETCLEGRHSGSAAGIPGL